MHGPKRRVLLFLLVLAPFVSPFHPAAGFYRKSAVASRLVEIPFARKLSVYVCRDRDRDEVDLLQERDSSPLHLQAPNLLVSQQQPDTAAAQSRRLFFASALLSTGALLGDPYVVSAAAPSADESLPWQTSPVNKRSGITVFEAEKSGYNVAFVTYLSRILLNFDSNCQRWWFSTRIPRGANAAEVEKIRLDQFAAFSASVEVGLLRFKGKAGARLLLQDLLAQYGTPPRVEDGKTGDEIQVALLFGLLEESTQPTKELTKLLASVDNGSVASVKLFNETFDGYEMGNEPPKVIFPSPQAGDDYEPAEGRAILKPTGKLLRIELVDPGSGYSTAPSVTIAPPHKGGTQATAEAKLASKGPNKGTVKSIQLVELGSGYADDDIPEITLSLPDVAGGEPATAYAILNMMIDQIEITKAGSGYAIEKPLTASVHGPERGTFILVGQARITAERSSFTGLSRQSDREQLYKIEEDFENKYNMKLRSSSVSAVDSDLLSLPFWSERSTSAELLRLLPSGIGLEYDFESKRYALSADTDFLSKYPAAVQLSLGRRINPDFGPRGRAPIERDMQLGLDAYSRFALSGAICASAVHVALTPLDVVKTKVQTDPVKYPNILSSFGTIFKYEGIPTLFTGWLPTLLGNFIGGGLLYAVTEIIRRSLSEAAGVEAVNLEVPIIITAAGVASALGAVIICPFEAVRIRAVAQPSYAVNSGDVLQRMLNEEGIGSLLNAIPVFLVRNVPYAMTKFTIFDLSTEKMYEAFPAAQEELRLSLLVSLIGGVLGGTAAAMISNPADALISELKKAKSDISPLEAANNMLERAGPSAFFVGLPLRMLFYSLIASLTFVVYDAVRFALGIGSDDLKLYLDVLGGALGLSNPTA